MSSPLVPAPGTNLTVLVGTLTSAPELRPLPSGSIVTTLQVTVQREGAKAETVPVAWFDAPTPAATWAPGDEVLVTGRTVRRFFRAAGRTQSRTEVVAATVVPTRRVAAARRALTTALAPLLA
jgi:single-stranded DNA-binding protein